MIKYQWLNELKQKKDRSKKILIIISMASVLCILLSFYIPLNKDSLMEKLGFSFEIYDRNGILLQKGLSSNGYYFSYVKLKEIPEYIIKALINTEDKNFYSHRGVDGLAIIRAVLDNLKSGITKSGGSTITMQIARNIHNLKRNIFSKIIELWFSIRLENSFTKKQLLELYFNTIPFGKQIVGIKMASRIYFNKSPSELSTAQGAYLISLLKYPSHMNRKSSIPYIMKRQKHILTILYKKKIIDKQTYLRAMTYRINIKKPDYVKLSPHFCNFILSHIKNTYPDKIKKIAKIYTTMDIEVQKKAFKYSLNSIKKLKRKKISNASVIILDNKSGDILAMIGSLNYFIDKDSGQVNGSIALRSPGSTLKPFTYATGIDAGIITSATVIPDIKTYMRSTTGDFTPLNHSRRFNGPITVRKALGCSYNIPAARVIAKTTVDAVLLKLHQAGFISLKKNPEYYGASLTLGGGDVSLLELTRGYRMLANNGIYSQINFIKKIIDIYGNKITLKKSTVKRQVFSRETAFLITDILSDNKAREDSFSLLSPLNLPFFCAAKTGTSKGYRNNWTIGYSRNYTLGVWVGNFDNSPMLGVSGITGAGNIFRSIMLSIEDDYYYKPVIPKSVVIKNICAKSGLLSKKECTSVISEYFTKNSCPETYCNVHFSIPYYIHNNKIAYVKNKKNNPNIRWEKTMILPPVYNNWLQEKGYRLPDKDVLNYIGWLSGKNKKNEIKEAKITFPDNNDAFIIDPIIKRKFQTIVFTSTLPSQTTTVYWILNDRKFKIEKYPFSYKWKIKRGEFTLKVEAVLSEGLKIKSKPVYFIVN